MKTIIAAAIALTIAAPAFADVSNARAFFALGNDSAAERVVNETSTGDINAALDKFIATKDSAAERNIVIDQNPQVSRDVQAFFAMGNSSAAEISVN